MTVTGIDHVQLAAPAGCETEARRFYGELLGMEELPKPEPIRARGGCWFRAGAQELHVGVEPASLPRARRTRASSSPISTLVRARFREAGVEWEDDTKIAGVDRLFAHDPFGNRLELA